jgi:hypothetical protein
MNHRLLRALTGIILLIIPHINYGQTVNLGTAANFVLFTSAGAVTNSSGSLLTGNVGTNSGSSTGFGNVNGSMENNNSITATCGSDLLIAYNMIDTATPTSYPSGLLGNGDTLTAGVYHVASDATLSLNLILNAQGNANAVFIFQVQGTLSAGVASKVVLINGALACNVFWKVEGVVSMASGATMRGTVIANNAAINLSTNDTLEGRVLSTNGAVSVGGLVAATPIGCGSPVLTGPAAPALVSTAAYGIFSGDGSVTNTGITHVIGDVGSNLGLTTGFNPLFVTGTIHSVPDASTATCASDLTNVYNYLIGLPDDIQLLYPAQFGNGLVLTPHTYLMSGATTFTGTVYLNAEGDANAIFVIQINGALSSSTFSNVSLINGAQEQNVYWVVDGAVNINDNSHFSGTLVANNGAITFNSGDTLDGRAMTTNGAVTINGVYVNTTSSSSNAGTINGPSTVCIGSSIILSDTTAGGVWSASNAHALVTDSVVTGLTAGIDTIMYTVIAAGDTSVAMKIITVGVGQSAGTISGPGTVCAGSSITLTDTATGGIWSSSNADATVLDGLVTGITAGVDTIRYTVTSGCGSDTAMKSIVITSTGAGTISGSSNVCTGLTTVLTDPNPGGVWSATNADATVAGGLVTGVTPGIDTIKYAFTNACGSYVATKAVTVGVAPNVGVISGPATVCAGNTITLTETASGGVWHSSNARALVSPVGTSTTTVTALTAGLDTIQYIVTAACGNDTAAKPITINQVPVAGPVTGPASVCVGSSIVLADATAGGVWSGSNATALVTDSLVTGISAGTDTVTYTVSNTCGSSSAQKMVTVNPLPDAGVISGASEVCVGSAVLLSENVPDGVWTGSNTHATVLSNAVLGVTPGIDTISYTVTNLCGSSSATKAITINALPVAGVISGPSSVCDGAFIVFTNTVSGGVWSITNNVASIADSMVTGTGAGIDTVNYTVASTSCGSATASAIITVEAAPAAVAISTQNPSDVCTDMMYQNFGAASGPDSGLAYQWTATGATVWAQGTAHQYSLVNFTQAGTADVTLNVISAATGCSSQTTVAVSVGPGVADQPQVIYSEGSLICLQYDMQSYQWGYDDYLLLDSTILPGEVNQNYMIAALDTTKFYWVITTRNNCMQKTYYIAPAEGDHRTSAQYVTPVQSVSGTDIKIYPNPTTEDINIAITTAVPGNITVSVKSITGQQLFSAQAIDNKAKINVAGLSAGIYLIDCYRDGIKISAARFTKN